MVPNQEMDLEVDQTLQVMRTIGVSCLTNDWMASVRTTLGGRSTWRISTRSIGAAMDAISDTPASGATAR